MRMCARKVLDSADIVRDGDVTPIDRRCMNAPL